MSSFSFSEQSFGGQSFGEQSFGEHAPSPRYSAARLTPVGRGAVATIRLMADPGLTGGVPVTMPDAVSGAMSESTISGGTPNPDTNFPRWNALFEAVNGAPFCQQPVGQIVFGRWGTTDIEELVVCRTALGTWEIYCHGGEAAVQRVLKDLAGADCQILNWQEQVAASESLLDAEILEVLSQATTWRTTRMVLEQSRGLLRTAFLRLIELHQAGDETGLIRELDRLLHWSDFGLHLSKPWSIVLTGRPNVGKSSLINGLLGYQRAIVFDQPGTTRDIVTGETAFEGWPVMLADTAGLRSHAPDLEAAGIALARERLRVADLKLVLLDLSQSPTAEDFELLSEYPEGLVVAHKCDLADRWGDQLPHGVFRVSSVTGEGMAALQQQLVSRLVPRIPPKQTPIPLTQPQVEMLNEIRRASTITARDQGIQRVRLICRGPTPLPEIAQNGSK